MFLAVDVAEVDGGAPTDVGVFEQIRERSWFCCDNQLRAIARNRLYSLEREPLEKDHFARNKFVAHFRGVFEEQDVVIARDAPEGTRHGPGINLNHAIGKCCLELRSRCAAQVDAPRRDVPGALWSGGRGRFETRRFSRASA